MDKKIAVLIPVHELTVETKILLSLAIKSVKEQTVKPDYIGIVTPLDGEDKKYMIGLLEDSGLEHGVIVNDSNLNDYCSQVNFGVGVFKSLGYEFFSILELDDEYSKTMFLNFKTYNEAYPEVDGFLPIVLQTDTNNKFIGYTNEAAWAEGFGEKVGYLDLQALLAYESFTTTGAVLNVEKFLDAGGFKSNIKLHFMYELLLRLVNEDFKLMIIPKLGYKHVNFREGSLFDSYKSANNGITPHEALYYLDVAKKEYFFNPNIIKRDITYTSSAEAI